MSRQEEILDLARSRGMIRAADIESEGISRNYLYRMCREGLLVKRAVGLYGLPEPSMSENFLFAEMAKRMPHAVVCLISALYFHGLTSQIPHEVWLTIPRGSWRPAVDYPKLKLFYVSGPAYSFGVEQHGIHGVPVSVYSPAKTVADCFKFRNKVGLDVAIEALREVWRSRKATMDELVEAAGVNRVLNIMRPYLEAAI